jgi:hypothetical protein
MMRLSQIKIRSSSRCRLGVVLWLGLVVGCSGRSTDPDGSGGSAGGGGKASGGGTGSIPVPGSGGNQGGASADGPSAAPLSGPAAFDFDCGQNGELPPGTKCSSCQMTSCAAELATALGSDWHSGTADGPCGAWFDCIQACMCNDQFCYQACTPHLVEDSCQRPGQELDTCVTQKCRSACSSSSL